MDVFGYSGMARMRAAQVLCPRYIDVKTLHALAFRMVSGIAFESAPRGVASEAAEHFVRLYTMLAWQERAHKREKSVQGCSGWPAAGQALVPAVRAAKR